MKKVMCLVLALALLCSLCACGKKETEEPQKDSNVTAEKQPEKETEKATEVATEPAEEEETNEFMFPLVEIYCKTPAEYGSLDNGSVAVTTGRDEFIVSICNGDEGSYSGDIAGVFEHMLVEYTIDVNKYLSPDADDQAWDLTATDGASISGYEATKLTGTVGNTEGGTYQVYGYSAIIEDRPVIFLGILCSEDQAQADMDTMTALVEQMAGSIYKK